MILLRGYCLSVIGVILFFGLLKNSLTVKIYIFAFVKGLSCNLVEYFLVININFYNLFYFI